MTRYIVLGVNDNPKYLYFIPLIYWAWRHFGWHPILFYSGDIFDKRLDLISETFDKLHDNMSIKMKHLYKFECYPLYPINGFKSDTIAQVSRLYGSCVKRHPQSILMTSDCDMLPLSDYWNPSDLNITCYGRDLTDYHYPICYSAMTPSNWINVMMLTGEDYNYCIKEDLELRDPKTNSWLWDQDILTERLNMYGPKLITRVDRGTDKRTGYPLGRVDRSNWHLNHTKLIDSHLPHDVLTNDDSFHKVLNLLHHVWPATDFKWYIDYHRQFKKLL